MGFIIILDEEGKEHLIHTSIFDSEQPKYKPLPPNPWSAVWRRWDEKLPIPDSSKS
jgi:hypothetical protein